MERNKESLDKVLKELLENDYPRFTVQDLLKFVDFIGSTKRYDMLDEIAPNDKDLYLDFNKYDLMNFLHCTREGITW